MYLTKQIQIKKNHKLYGYFDDLCHKTNNLYNATVFLIRQYATAKQAFENMQPLFDKQMEVYQMVESKTINTQFYPKTKWLNYRQIDFLFKVTKNDDYYALPVQCSQQIIKLVLRDFKSYFQSIKLWQSNKAAFTGMPKMPGYKTSGGKSTILLTNQDCKIYGNKLKLPLTKVRLSIASIGKFGSLQEVRIKPNYIGFTIDIVLEKPIEGEIINDEHHNAALLTKYKDIMQLNERALGIDIGLSNLCAVVNNCGLTPFLIKGTPLKSINQLYNKRLAYYQSIAKTVNGVDYTNRMYYLTRKRNNQIKDYRKVNNQNFAQIPTTMLINQLQYKLNKLGIELLVIEESYTSKASFENLDYLPTYGEEVAASFSGKRIHHGLYQTNGKRPVNADVNGAANILRKAFPNVRGWDSGVVDTPVVKRVA